MPTPHRSDARLNRAAILRTAGVMLTGHRERSLSFQRIAHLTGLGLATIYRHFPDRRALALAVAQEHLAVLDRMVATHDTDPTAFRTLLHEVLRSQVSMRPLVGVLRGLPPCEQRRHTNQLTSILSGPFHRSREAGQLRADVTLDHVALVLSMLEAAVHPPPEHTSYETTAQRAIEVILAGLFKA